MSRHDYSQSTVSSISYAIVNCKSTVENTVLSVESMPYSWDSGIINNVVTWFEVRQIIDSKEKMISMFKKAVSDFNDTVKLIAANDENSSESMETGLTTLSVVMKKIDLIYSFTQLYPTVSQAGCFKNLSGFIKQCDNNVDKIRRDVQLSLHLLKLSGKHTENVKSYVESMKEPYQSIYMKTVDKYTIGNTVEDYSTKENETGFFDSLLNTINVNMDEEPVNPRGAYVTYFHESGHAIDYNYNNDGSYFSLTYRNKKGQSLYDVILIDVQNDIKNTISNYVVDETTQKNILDYVMSGAHSGSLSNDEIRVLQQVQSDYYKKFAGATNEAPSDVYGGITDNIIRGNYIHDQDGYWYNSDGSPTYSQSKELWAEYYSYCATGDKDNLEALSRYFPNAKKFMDEMSWEMAGFEEIN